MSLDFSSLVNIGGAPNPLSSVTGIADVLNRNNMGGAGGTLGMGGLAPDLGANNPFLMNTLVQGQQDPLASFMNAGLNPLGGLDGGLGGLMGATDPLSAMTGGLGGLGSLLGGAGQGSQTQMVLALLGNLLGGQGAGQGLNTANNQFAVNTAPPEPVEPPPPPRPQGGEKSTLEGMNFKPSQALLDAAAEGTLTRDELKNRVRGELVKISGGKGENWELINLFRPTNPTTHKHGGKEDPILDKILNSITDNLIKTARPEGTAQTTTLAANQGVDRNNPDLAVDKQDKDRNNKKNDNKVA